MMQRNAVLTLFILALLCLPGIVRPASNHADSSVLASGRWFKMAVTRDGVYQVTYADLQQLGLEPESLNPALIRIFGNGGGMLPEVNIAPRIDDLREISVWVQDGGDGRFDAGDKILFYGESADKWKYEKLTRNYSHQRNLYSDTTWYFLNADQVQGRRVVPLPPPADPPTHFSSGFDDFVAHELDSLSLVRSGKEWYGEFFDSKKSEYRFAFSFPGIDSTYPLKVKWSVVGNASVISYFYLTGPKGALDSIKIESTFPGEYTRAGRGRFKSTVFPNPGPEVELKVSYKLPNPITKGWLNYLEVGCRRHLAWTGGQMLFRDLGSVAAGRITEFTLASAPPDVTIWDVTNPGAVLSIQPENMGGALKFSRTTDTLREFVAFDGTQLLPVRCVGEVPNQNLHGLQPAGLVIVTHPLFREQADRLAGFHRAESGLTVLVEETTRIYNEFSCGQPDPAAIRDFLKMLYDRGNDATKPRYLLLFGDGSYDPKDRIPGNNNLVPTFQSLESLTSTGSYVTDDFFGIMPDNAGQDANGTINIGIGRFPVSTKEEAKAMVDKIFRYAEKGSVIPDWRNVITFVADDENQNLHLHHAEELASIVDAKYPVFNVAKIFFDAYKLIKIPGGERFPDATAALNQAVKKGSLIINYTGHGGETGWSYEQALTVPDILSWKYPDRMPVFVTATCEFSRFDNPERYTAGEMLINLPDGGAIALYSTTRLAYAGSNIFLNTSFFNHLRDRDSSGQFIRMGDLIRLTKNDNANNAQLRNFVLLGDPAQNIAFPSHGVRVMSVNGKPDWVGDTALGLTRVTVSGRIEGPNGLKDEDFKGRLSCKFFDKPVTHTTMGNRPDGETYPENFLARTTLLFQGEVPVDSGVFQVSFTIPRGVALPMGKGKLSFFASNDEVEAAGFYDRIIVGGRDESVNPVNPGPEISLYLDNRSFIDGGTTERSAILLADLADSNGINFLGLGIGHEIEAVLDGDRSKAMVLNDYFAPAFNDPARGTVTFPLTGLTPGRHTLRLKAWDLFDNASEREISFVVPEYKELVIKNVGVAPNPVAGNTKFRFTPDRYEAGNLEVRINIYNLHGMVVRRLSAGFDQPIVTPTEIAWDGTDEQGKKLPAGLYPYKILFQSTAGPVSATSGTLVIVRN